MNESSPSGQQRFLSALREFRPEIAEFRMRCLQGRVGEPERSFVLRRVIRLKSEDGALHYSVLKDRLLELERALNDTAHDQAIAGLVEKVLDAALYALTFSGELPEVSESGTMLKHWRLVIADDDRIVREMMLQLFAGEAEVHVAPNGREAYALIERHRPHLVILDDFMPEMTGLKLIETLHASPELGAIPVMMLTGSDRERDRMRAMQAGAIDYITKPFDPAVLKRRVQQRLSGNN